MVAGLGFAMSNETLAALGFFLLQHWSNITFQWWRCLFGELNGHLVMILSIWLKVLTIGLLGVVFASQALLQLVCWVGGCLRRLCLIVIALAIACAVIKFIFWCGC